MTPEQFTYWLQGFAEIAQDAPSEKEWEIIKDHLSTVFTKVTPDRMKIGNIKIEPIDTAPKVFINHEKPYGPTVIC